MPARQPTLWHPDPSAFPHGPIEQQLAFICRYGILAPSVHNTQPWRFQIVGPRLHLYLESSRQLKAGDATGREAWISLGACAENLIVAASSFGLEGKVDYQALRQHDHPEQVVIGFRATARRPDHSLLTAILERRTDRSLYTKKKLTTQQSNHIQDSYQSPLVATVVTARSSVLEAVANLTGRGIMAAFSNPEFRAELASLIHHQPHRPLGIPTYSLELGPLRGRIESKLVRYGLHRKRQAELEARRMESAAALILTFSRGDTAAHWFEAGRAYEHAALISTSYGLATATTAAVVEAFDFHQDIEQLMDNPGRLQTVMRVGYSQTKLRPVSRLDMAQVLAPA